MAETDELERQIALLKRQLSEISDVIFNHVDVNASSDYPHPITRVQYLEFARNLGIGSQLANPPNGSVLTADNTIPGGLKWASSGGSVPDASETVKGIAEIATQAETDAGTDDARIVTPAKLANWSGRTRKYTQTIGDGVNTQIDVTHNFGTRDVLVEVYNASSYDTVFCDVTRITINVVRFNFASAPATNSLRVVIIG